MENWSLMGLHVPWKQDGSHLDSLTH
uniref:Uncharacterized protein n=1 Tax=Anguilla anguilla TaxID=7936 RepID=A0A0E9UUB5_ANGAN